MGGKLWRYDPYDVTKYEAWSIRYVVDVGANVGGFSLMTRVYFPCAKVHAVEPDRDSFKLLQDGARVWRVLCHNTALGPDGDEMISVRPEGSASSGYARFYTSAEWGGVPEYRTPSLSLASMFSQFKVDARLPVILKVDCEGGERFMLQDRAGSLGCMRSSIQTCLELHFGHGGKAEEWAIFLKELQDTHDVLLCKWYRDEYRRHYHYVPVDWDELASYHGAQVQVRRKDWARYKRGAPPRSDGMWGDEGVNW